MTFRSCGRQGLGPAGGKILAGLGLLGGLFLTGCAGGGPLALDSTARMHKDLLVVDSHVDIPLYFGTAIHDPGKNLDDAQVDLPKMKKGGVDAAFFVVYVPQRKRDALGYLRAKCEAQSKFWSIHGMTDGRYKDQIELARSAADVRRINGSGKLAALIGVENGFAIGKNLDLLKSYYDQGARYMSLTHNGHNDLADSAIPRPDLGDKPVEHGGVSPLGRQVIAEMNRLGMMVDVAHGSRQTVLDAARLSKAPIISSHHALKHFVDIPRNMSDEELKAVAKTGGVVQIVAYDTYVRPIDPARQAAQEAFGKAHGLSDPLAFYDKTWEEQQTLLRQEHALARKYPRGTLDDLIDEIDYAVKLVGIDHVGIASDFDGGGGVVGWDDASETPNVTRKLVDRGYSKEDIAKLWGGNLLRVMAKVEQVAARQ